ncbi:hypothetical protein K7X08_023053 [Anisodus acutangulus]|uniref:MADS-box domain-containing protein n=1 Tax=Anisodus acutangulus TaxID=402998 RepID=A0A9Q1RHA6_9SOLA|nr:hypothetical protein K7X08_023053 [Anisodus acutangulus]
MERKLSQDVELKFIKDKRAEHAIISNIQKSLCKKAKDLSILCGIEIAMIMFSIAGQPFLFGIPDVESVVQQFLEVKKLTASPSNRYIMKKRKIEERENKGKAIDLSEDFKLTDLGKLEKLNEKIKKFDNHLIKEIVELQSVTVYEDPKYVFDMNVASTSTLPSNCVLKSDGVELGLPETSSGSGDDFGRSGGLLLVADGDDFGVILIAFDSGLFVGDELLQW